ncbi:MAG TPA: OmpH family outer membrane protein [Chitinophagaceae bacterium]
MKNGILIFNIVLLILVGLLVYLHFAQGEKSIKSNTNANVSSNPGDFKIAYFEMDSIENSFAMVKDVKAELSKKEETINNELERLEKNYRNKIAKYQAQGASMTQVQSEMAQRDVMQLQQNIQSRRQQLEQEYQELQMRKLKDVKTKIEDFLKEYNKDKRYSYILSYEPGLFYYRDSAYNITSDVITGLNSRYDKKD